MIKTIVLLALLVCEGCYAYSNAKSVKPDEKCISDTVGMVTSVNFKAFICTALDGWMELYDYREDVSSPAPNTNIVIDSVKKGPDAPYLRVSYGKRTVEFTVDEFMRVLEHLKSIVKPDLIDVVCPYVDAYDGKCLTYSSEGMLVIK